MRDTFPKSCVYENKKFPIKLYVYLPSGNMKTYYCEVGSPTGAGNCVRSNFYTKKDKCDFTPLSGIRFGDSFVEAIEVPVLSIQPVEKK